MQMAPKAPTVGVMLREWRTTRRKSQLTMSIEAGVSTRHLSFVETGRSMPSRDMVLTLAEALEVPLRERNTLLEAAGFAAEFRETPLGAPSMNEVRDALEHMLRASEPNPTLVVNRRYDVLMANEAARRLIADFAPGWEGPLNIVSMLLSPRGLKPSVSNWGEVAHHVAMRTRAELEALRVRDEADDRVLAEIAGAQSALLRAASERGSSRAVLIPLRLRRGELARELFTTITTLGTPLDITLQELRIETLFPARAGRERERDRPLILSEVPSLRGT